MSGATLVTNVTILQDGEIEPDQMFAVQLATDLTFVDLISPTTSLINITSPDSKKYRPILVVCVYYIFTNNIIIFMQCIYVI